MRRLFRSEFALITFYSLFLIQTGKFKTGFEQVLNALVDFLHSKKQNGDEDIVVCLCDVQKMGDLIANENKPHDRDNAMQQEIEHISAVDGESEIVDEKKTDTRDSSKRMTEEVIDEEVANTDNDEEEKERLHKMGLNTAIAIGLHNFPEGEYRQTV